MISLNDIDPSSMRLPVPMRPTEAVAAVALVMGERYRCLAEQSERLHRRLEGRTGGPGSRFGPRTAHSAPRLLKLMAASHIRPHSRTTAPTGITARKGQPCRTW